ncbi:MAG: polysaccharide deacetylase family protein, partial [Pseudomonadota bacterium]
MTRAIISFDTELSAGLYQRGQDARANFESSILGRCRDGDFGIVFQMDMLERYGLKGVFFVDPMPALVHGPSIVRDIVAPIVARGHEVQLHIHTEWLAFARFNPVGRLTGRNIGDFPLAAQKKLIGLAADMLVRAGAPDPVAFRAGNFGANDDTLRALAALGFAYDSSFNGAYVGHGCDIALDRGNIGMRMHHGVCEVPVSGLMDRADSFRPAQL